MGKEQYHVAFRFYRNAICQASRNVAAAIFIVGLLLVGFGVVILAAPAIFAFLTAMIFFFTGIGCAITAMKIFWVQKQFGKLTRDDSQAYRHNAKIHVEGHPFDEI